MIFLAACKIMDTCHHFFPIKRGVRQGDPLSPYLFILCVELLSASLKNNPKIKGIKIQQSEYLVSQYADDTTLTLSDDKDSLNESLNCINNFANCSGLKANFEKTSVIWIGAKRGCGEEINTILPVLWNHGGIFRLLGTNYNLNNDNITHENFIEGLQKIKRLLNDWSLRSLSLLGKITVIKTLALPIIVHHLTSLPNPGDKILQEIQLTFFKFLWNGSKDKIKRAVLYNSKEKGGLNMPHIKIFSESLKLTWIKKVLDPRNNSPWKCLISDKLETLGGENFWKLGSLVHARFSSKFSSFWNEIIQIWSKLNIEPTAPEKVTSQPIWCNPNIIIGNKTIFKQNWIDKDIIYINDLIDGDGNFFSYIAFRALFDLQTNFLDYQGIINSIKNKWRETINTVVKEPYISNTNIDLIKQNIKPSKAFYQSLSKRFCNEPLLIKNKWQNELDPTTAEYRWDDIFLLPYRITDDSKLQSFQFKLLHRIIFTNSKLLKCNLVPSELCTFCNERKETLLHLFVTCSRAVTIWRNLELNLRQKCNLNITFSRNDIVLGLLENNPTNNSLNLLILLVKRYLYVTKCKIENPTYCNFILFVKNYQSVDLGSSHLYAANISQRIISNWQFLASLLM